MRSRSLHPGEDRDRAIRKEGLPRRFIVAVIRAFAILMSTRAFIEHLRRSDRGPSSPPLFSFLSLARRPGRQRRRKFIKFERTRGQTLYFRIALCRVCDSYDTFKSLRVDPNARETPNYDYNARYRLFIFFEWSTKLERARIEKNQLPRTRKVSLYSLARLYIVKQSPLQCWYRR